MAAPPPTPLGALHAAFGGVIALREGVAVATAYGDPRGEYLAAREKAGLAELAERGVLEVSGPLRQKFLQGLLSNEVLNLQPGQGSRAALLTVKGAVQALLRVSVEPEVVALETSADRLDGVRRTLEHYRVAAPVRFAGRPTVVLALFGPDANDVARAAGLERLPLEAEAHTRATLGGYPARLVRALDLPGGGLIVHVAPQGAAAAWQALHFAGARPVGRDALDARRIETARPWYGPDVSEDNLLHETGLLAECHSPSKGCYLGQEVVARLEARGGHVNKALRALKLTARAAAGDAITADGKNVGRVTTAAVSPRNGPIALGYVHRSHFAAGSAVVVAGAGAVVVEAFEEDE